MSNVIQFFTDIAGQANKAPAILIVAALLFALDTILRVVKPFPNRLIIIPMVIVGTLLGALLGDPGHVSPTQAYPRVILGMYGFILAVAVWGGYRLILLQLQKRLPEGAIPKELLEETAPPFPKADGSNVKPPDKTP